MIPMKITAGRNIFIEKNRDFYRIHAVSSRNTSHDTAVDFFTAAPADIAPGSLVSITYDCSQPGTAQLFEAETLTPQDPLFAGGCGNIALVTEYHPQRRTGRAVISGCVSVPVRGKQAGRSFLLPDGNGGFVYSKRGGARIMLPPKETDDGVFCTMWLGEYGTEPGLYTGAFTADFADTDASEYIIYDSSSGSLAQPSGIIAWGDMSMASRVSVPVMKRNNDGKGIALSLDPETLIPSIFPLPEGMNAYSTEVAGPFAEQLLRTGNIKMWWML